MKKRELRERIEWLETRESEYSQVVCDMQQRIDELEVRLAVLEANRIIMPYWPSQPAWPNGTLYTFTNPPLDNPDSTGCPDYRRPEVRGI